ncbi:MAG: hypothetical protein ACK4ZY_13355 [Sphingomonas sp.]
MQSRSRPLAASTFASLALSALLAGLLPGGDRTVALALLAAVSALVAGQECRHRDMLVAAGIAAALAPAGWLVAPLCLGRAFARGAGRHLLIAAAAGGAVYVALPWQAHIAALPNLATLAMAAPDSLALVAALGTGCAAWIAARAASAPAAAFLHEARLGVVLLAAILPLPMAALGFVLVLAALPLPASPRRSAANDNAPVRRIRVRLAA